MLAIGLLMATAKTGYEEVIISARFHTATFNTIIFSIRINSVLLHGKNLLFNDFMKQTRSLMYNFVALL